MSHHPPGPGLDPHQSPSVAIGHEQGHTHGHEHPPFLAHHWATPKQQFEAGKLGMWLFLATEVLLFGGLFCAYSVWRGNHPEMFKYGSQFLDTSMGAINTAVLILSSLTMAWGVTCAQKNQQTGLKICLILTLAGAVMFLVIKYFEYSHKFHEGWFPGMKFYERPGHAETWDPARPVIVSRNAIPVVAAGGAGAAGAATVGAETTPPNVIPADMHATDTVPPGRSQPPPADTQPSTNAEHPPPATARPGTQPETQPGGGGGGGGGFELETISITMRPAPSEPPLPAVEASTVLPAATGPQGLAEEPQLVETSLDLNAGREEHEEVVHPLQDAVRPDNAHKFFDIYFMMTGLHGIHVVIGMIVIIWLLVGAMQGKFSSEYFTPVDLGGLYWHVVDLIWIFLFPLFYLI